MSILAKGTPLYRLVNDETGDEYARAVDLAGFFLDHLTLESAVVTLVDAVAHVKFLPTDIDNVRMEVIDRNGQTIGRYYIGRVRPIVQRTRDDLLELDFSFYGFSCGYPRAGDIWRRWASGAPIKAGEWMDYPAYLHETWLHVVQNVWFEKGRTATRYASEYAIAIDGDLMPDVAAFYCAIGEAVNGPGGYYGATLDGLAECLSSTRSNGVDFRLIWSHGDASRRMLGEEFVASVLDLMGEFGIETAI
ncbi:MAG TPA: barstar family protein [Kineosporiaceae bacterium]